MLTGAHRTLQPVFEIGSVRRFFMPGSSETTLKLKYMGPRPTRMKPRPARVGGSLRRKPEPLLVYEDIAMGIGNVHSLARVIFNPPV